jgi:hypothetical protein
MGISNYSNDQEGSSAMCTYCSTKNYRKIYENHIGPIPTEAAGRTYEIHHIDGNRDNNNCNNLKAVTLQEHYDIHYSQGDYAACKLMKLQRMNKTPEEISELSRLHSVKQFREGNSPLQRPDVVNRSLKTNREKLENGTHAFCDQELRKQQNKERLENGTHPFSKREDGSSLGRDNGIQMMADGSHPFLDSEWHKEQSKKKRERGTHNFKGGDIQRNRVKNGTHPSQVKWTCEYCGLSGKGKGNLTRSHGKNCKSKINLLT